MTDSPTIMPYTPQDADRWNAFVDEARNGTFLLRRDYMDYHADRFEDASLMAYFKGKLQALLPACRHGDTTYSHKGLTYGGWVLPMQHIDASEVLRLFDGWRRYELQRGVTKCIYKPMPHIYARRPSQDDIYALFRMNASMNICNLSCAIYLPDAPYPAKWQKRYLNIARRLRPEPKLVCDGNGSIFYPLLAECLRERHGTTPVHSYDEFRLLLSRFPDNIHPIVLMYDGQPQAGICLYLTHTTAHCQYIATTPFARKHKLLTLLVDKLLELPEIRSRRYLDFGTSNEHNGLVLNTGLYHNKFSYGGGGVVYPSYSIDFTTPPRSL